MIKFSSEKVKLLHQLMAQATGGSVGVRDEGLLDSAIEGAFATFDGVELYPSKEEKAAKLGYSLISNHAFVDGNKRIGVYKDAGIQTGRPGREAGEDRQVVSLQPDVFRLRAHCSGGERPGRTGLVL